MQKEVTQKTIALVIKTAKLDANVLKAALKMYLNIPKCVGMERLCKDVNMQIPFNADEINLIYQFGEQTAALYTRDKAVMRKLDTLVADFPDTYSLTGQDEVEAKFNRIASAFVVR